MATPAIEVNGLSKSFGTQRVLRGVDLSVQAGTVFALLGPNGAGKTTLINILSTLVAPDGGTATVAGHDVVTAADGVRAAISLTGQSAAVDEVLTGEENLRMMARLSGYSAAGSRQRAQELIERFDLALSLVATPPVIFLDEPTTGLDTRSRQALWDMILALAAQGITILLTTQYLEEADQLADRIALIDDGVVVAEGTPAELKARIGGDVVELRGPDDTVLRELATDGSVHALRAAIDELDAVGVPDAHVSIRKPSLDDVFLALTATTASTAPASHDEHELEVSV